MEEQAILRQNIAQSYTIMRVVVTMQFLTALSTQKTIHNTILHGEAETAIASLNQLAAVSVVQSPFKILST